MNESERRWRVYRVTFDTNIFLRALIRRGNLANNLLSLWLDGRLVLVLSQAIVDEVQAVLSRPSLIGKYSYTPQAVTQLINLLMQRAIIVEVSFSLGLCRDANDNPLVDCAVLSRVQFLVSYDNDLLDDSTLRQALFEFGVEIVVPRLSWREYGRRKLIPKVNNYAKSLQ